MTVPEQETGWRRWLLGSRAPVLALVVAVVVSIPSLFAGLFMDDYIHQLLLAGGPGLPGDGWSLFTFATGDAARVTPLIEHGPYPWWTWPEVRLSFFRPLTCALAQADHALFGRFNAGHHLHSVLWFLALIGTVGALLRRALGPAAVVPATALATVLFAIDDVHAVPMAWIANRNALVATVPALLGLLAHVRWREEGFKPGLPLSLLGYTLGLAGGEAALGALAYLLAYELCAAPGSRRERALALLPVALLGIGYVALYKGIGAGAKGSGIYVDPVAEPLEFLLAAPGRALALAGGQLLAFPADAWLLVPQLRAVLVAAGLAGIGLVAFLLRAAWPSLPERSRAGIAWLASGAALSLIPVLATFPLNRLLLMPSIGGAAAVAFAILHGIPAGGGKRIAAGVLLLANGVLPPVSWAVSYAVADRAARTLEDSALVTSLSDEALTRRVVLFAAPDAAVGLYPALVRLWHGKQPPRAWLPISIAPYPHRLTRTAADRVELEVVGGRMLETVFEQLVRSDDLPVPVGFTVELDGVVVKVLELDGGLPRRVELRFLDDPMGGSYTFVGWRDRQLVALELPAIGGSVELPHLPGVLAL